MRRIKGTLKNHFLDCSSLLKRGGGSSMNTLMVAFLPIQSPFLEMTGMLDYYFYISMTGKHRQDELKERIIQRMKTIGVTKETINEWLKCNPEMDGVILWESGLYSALIDVCKKNVGKVFDDDEQHSIAADAVLRVLMEEIKKPANKNKFEIVSFIHKAFVQSKRRTRDLAINKIKKDKNTSSVIHTERERNEEEASEGVEIPFEEKIEEISENKLKKGMEIYSEVYNKLGKRKNNSRRVHLESLFRALSIEYKDWGEDALKFAVLYFLGSEKTLYAKLPSGVKEAVIYDCCKSEITYHTHTNRLRRHVRKILKSQKINEEFFKG